MNEELCFWPATRLREAIGRREVSPVEVVQAVLQRAERLQDRLNCFVTICGDEALREARAAESAVMRGKPLGLLHGSQPDRFVVCHEPGRAHVLGNPAFALPSIEQVIEQTIALGRLTNPSIRCVGVSLNTAKLDEAGTRREFDSVEKRLSLPVADPMRGGPAFERLLDACCE
jgi:uncharacterized NAD-dependent epimerase/dehydratase family protein